MGNSLLGYLAKDFVGGVLDSNAYLKDFKHASNLFVGTGYDMAPKAGWSYFVEIGLNPKLNTIAQFLDTSWYQNSKGKLGVLAKQVDLPRFTVATETMNQYNKKTVVQTKINYNPVSITFHDDIGNMMTNFWKNYYSYYYADPNYTGQRGNSLAARTMQLPSAYDKKSLGAEFSPQGFSYGLNNQQTEQFISYITIYQMNKKNYTSITLINPIITDWSSGTLDNTGSKMMDVKMTVAYEAVYYGDRKRITSSDPGHTSLYYDLTRSPLSSFGRGKKGLSGLLGGATDVLDIFNKEGPLSAADWLNVAIGTKNLVTNARQLSKSGVKQELYGMAVGAFAGAAAGNKATGEQSALGQVMNRPLNLNIFQPAVPLYNSDGTPTTMNANGSINYNGTTIARPSGVR